MGATDRGEPHPGGESPGRGLAAVVDADRWDRGQRGSTGGDRGRGGVPRRVTVGGRRRRKRPRPWVLGFYGLETFGLNAIDGLQAQVNLATGNLVVHGTDLKINAPA